MTQVPWLLACDFDRSSDLQVGMPPLVLSTTKLWSGDLGWVPRTFFKPASFPMGGCVRTVENAGRVNRGVHASDDGRITALFTPRWFPVRDMTAGTKSKL